MGALVALSIALILLKSKWRTRESMRRRCMSFNVIDEDFALWAFGDVWHSYLVYDADAIDLKDAWNEMHHHLLFIQDVHQLMEELEAMKEIYEDVMDKKMHKVTEKMKVAEKDVKKGKPAAAVKVLKGAEKKNEKLVKIDKTVRDPIIKNVTKALPAIKKSIKGK